MDVSDLKKKHEKAFGLLIFYIGCQQSTTILFFVMEE